MHVLLLLLSLGLPATAQSIDWRAEWIQLADTSGLNTPNQWLCFKTRFELDAVPASAPTAVAVDSKYWLWVNGKLVIFEGGLKRGPNPEDTYYDPLDLAPYLQPGENTVAILVWFFGKDGFSHKNSGMPGLLFQSDLGGRYLLSDTTWRGMHHPAFRPDEAPFPNYRLPESNIYFDAGRDIAGWYSPGYDETAWPRCRTVGLPPVSPWNRLAARPIPFWKNAGLQSYPQPPDLPLTSRGDTLDLALPYNAQITPYFRIRAPRAGLRIDLRTDNYRGGGPPNVRTVYLTKSGEQAFETPGWMNGHRVRYHFPPGVEILDLKYRETGYATDFAGSFRSDDAFLNRLWQKAARTLYITMRDTYMDCPDRERAQWWGDVVNELGETFYALDRRSDQLTRKAILELVHWQRPDSTLYSPVPAGNWDKELPMQMLASVGYYGFWTYFFHTGDTTTVREVYPHVQRYLAVWQTDSLGLVVPRTGGWTWGDWGDNKDLQLLYNAWYFLAQKGLHAMARLLDRPADAAAATVRMEQLAEVFNRKFWTGSAYRHPDYTGKTDDRAQALAVVSGIAPTAWYPAIRKVLQEAQHASPYMEKYVLEALYQMGYPGDALARMKTRFRPMVESSLTTLWEGWGIGKEGFGGGTYNHAWSGGGLTILSQFAAGISPLEPAYRRFRVAPQPGDLTQLEVVVPSVRGEIEYRFQREQDQGYRMRLTVPDGTTAEVKVPNLTAGRLRLNGNLLYRRGKMKKKGGKYFRSERAGRQLILPAGQWNIAVKYR